MDEHLQLLLLESLSRIADSLERLENVAKRIASALDDDIDAAASAAMAEWALGRKEGADRG